MAPRPNPKAVAACLRRTQGMVDGIIPASVVTESLLLAARQEQATGPAAQALAQAVGALEAAADAHRQCEQTQEQAARVVRQAKVNSDAVAERLMARLVGNPWPEVAGLHETATELRAEQKELDTQLEEVRKVSNKSMADLSRLAQFPAWVASSLLRTRITREKPFFLAKTFGRLLGVDEVVNTVVDSYRRLEELNA